MARKTQIYKFISAVAFMGIFIILLMNIFNSDYNYHYWNKEKKQHVQQQQQEKSQNKASRSKQVALKLDYKAREPLTYELVVEMQQKIPSLPLEYFYRHAKKLMQKFKNCAQYPALQALNFYNTYWQTLYVDNRIYQLYGAYYDERPQKAPVIRILAMSLYQGNEDPIIYCQLWFEHDSRPVLTRVKEYRLIWDPKWDIHADVYYPYLLTCEIPNNTNITGNPLPKVVNLVKHQCDTAKNSLRIIYQKPAASEKKQEFAVCVKGLDFPYEDLSARLVEWLELLSILGVHKVYIYRLQVHKNISKVLDYYQAKGFVEVQDITLVGGVVGEPHLQHWLIKEYPLNKRLNEIITYNDCFYRHMYKYDYIALLDIDEVIMPKTDLRNWQQLLQRTTQSYEKLSNCSLGYAALCATNVYFPGKLLDKHVPVGNNPLYLYMLNHAYRFEDYATEHHYVKCLHNTQQALTLHNHYPLSYLNTNCPSLDLSIAQAQLQHYRLETIKEEMGRDHQIIRDASLQRFQKPLKKRCTKVLRDLKFIN